MPKGVEHQRYSGPQMGWHSVIRSAMPKGVEHQYELRDDENCGVRSDQPSRKALSTDGTSLHPDGLLRCVPISDAEGVEHMEIRAEDPGAHRL